MCALCTVYPLWLGSIFTCIMCVYVARNRRRRRLCNNPKRGFRAMGVMNVQGIHTRTHTHTAAYTVPIWLYTRVYIDKLVDLIERCGY